MFSSNTSQVEGGYQISRSLRFNSADSAYLDRTPANAGNRKTWTLSLWFKRSALPSSGYQSLIGADSGGGQSFYVAFDNSSQQLEMGQGASVYRKTTQVFRDPSAWYHIVVALDTTQATADDRIKIYVNGAQITAFGTTTNPSQNSDLAWNSNVGLSVGADIATSGARNFFNGYMTEVNFIDGQALTPSSFGETNAQTGVWQPKAYSGSYGTNGFYLNFSDNSNTTAATLGKDYSGNGNNWTPNNFSVTAGAGNDSLVDTPTPYGGDSGAGGEVRGNYCTWSAVDRNPIFTLTNGNLDCAQSAADGSLRATIAVSSGKWYWEITVGTGNTAVGIALVDASLSSYLGGNVGGAGFNMSSGLTLVNSPFSSATGSSIGAFAANDIIGLALDFTDGTVKYYRNGTLITANHITNVSGLLAPAIGSNVATSGYIANFGQRPFAYTAPSGFKALCTQNLPTPTIGATTATQAGNYFVPTAYTGNGSSSRAITNGINMAANGGLVWTKQRSGVEWHFLIDNVRGNTKYLSSNATNAEGTISTLVTGFDSTGYSIGNDSGINSNGSTYVSWVWAAGGAGSTNTAGSITSTVSANTTSGFSIVTYTGNGANATIGHGLGVAPRLVIQKYRTASTNWFVYHASLGTDKYVLLNTTDSAFTNTGTWQNTAPTSSVFSVGAGINDNSYQMVAYCFAEVPGYSRFGSYTGNGSSDGPFVFCGFRPRYIMVKISNTDIGPGSGWHIIDTARSPFNVANVDLLANNSASEAGIGTSYLFDLNSNGFKLRTNDSYINGSGNTYIFAAFAEAPFKYALAR